MTLQSQMGKGLTNALESHRRHLLDQGLRNPLISFKYPKAKSVRVRECQGPELFGALVDDGTAFALLPNEVADDTASNDAHESPSPKGPTLHTDLTPARLRNVLKAINRDARSAIEEQGVNLLFLAIGVLRWYESESSDDVKTAPLLLVPVTLEPQGGDCYLLRYTGDDIEINLSLMAKLSGEFEVRVPVVPEIEQLDPAAYISTLEQAITNLPRWQVDANEVVLSFFSFAKYLMYKDLDPEAWPQGAGPLDHPILAGLLGDRFDGQPALLPEDSFLDDHLGAGEIPTVVDADSSQLAAIADVRAGRTLVIQGPPGTGKSQTITNLIADAIARQKTVLFVSEKQAALEVVKRRLDSVGLGDACLELHSRKTNKRAVLAELQRTLNLGRPRTQDFEGHLRQLEVTRDRLNAYSSAMNTPVGASRLTPFQALGEIVRWRQETQDAPLPRFKDLPMGDWTSSEYREALIGVEELAERLSNVGAVGEHPFRGTRRRVIVPSDSENLRQTLDAALEATRSLVERAGVLARELDAEVPGDRNAVEQLVSSAERLNQAPDLTGVQIRHQGWYQDGESLGALVEAGSRLQKAHANHAAALIPEAWDQDLLGVRTALAAHGRKWWRGLIGEYRQAKAKMVGLCRNADTPPGHLLQLADAVLEARRDAKVVQDHDVLGQTYFGDRWAGARSNWESLAEAGQWLGAFHLDLAAGRLPELLLNYLEANPACFQRLAVTELSKLLAQQADLVAQVLRLIDLDETLRFGEGGLLGLTFEAQLLHLGAWRNHLHGLQALINLLGCTDRLRERGLASVVDALDGWTRACNELLPAFQLAYHQAVLDRAFRERPPLAQFDSANHEQVRARFQELDRTLCQLNRARLALGHWNRLPASQVAEGQVQVLKREFEKRTRHMPIRKLLVKAGNVIQQGLKPVFMMSPLSIATYLPTDGIKFDLVVFDEASQVSPVDAFGAIARGSQVVVVGDDRQLPPTDFFARMVMEDLSSDDEDADVVDAESILGLFKAQGVPDRMLRWHYRSRHESLIAVSNRLFYDNRLVVFPSPDQARTEAGLVYRPVAESVYDRAGRSATNPGEARVIAAAVIAHARNTPHLTLGVAAFSVAQRDTILDELEKLQRLSDPLPFFAEHPNEPFFVKNLENIQGDERDVILVSVGYGKDAGGYVSMSFGPVNRDSGGTMSEGERRLNVLFTRARVRCEIFTNLQPEDLDLERSSKRGVRALRTFLTYARDGFLDVPEVTGREADSKFEEAVMQALTARGHRVVPQVGSAGFWIDLAVVDPRQPGRFLLGIECDGATYHSSRSARDRDRLRQQVLEGLNWRIHRIWSTDWFLDPQRELAKVEEAIAAAMADVPPPPEVATVPEFVPEREDIVSKTDHSLALPPYQQAQLAIDLVGREFHQLPSKLVAEWVLEVVAVESPVHVAEVGRRIITALGLKRLGSRIEAALEQAITLAVRDGLHRSGEFLWSDRSKTVLLRDRSAMPAASRKSEFVAPEELAAAILQVVQAGFGIEAVHMPSAVGRLLGFGRTSEDLALRIQQEVNHMIREGRLQARNGHLVIS